MLWKVPNRMHALIVGASRGIGFEFVRQYRADGVLVSATARDAAGLARLQALDAKAVALDVTDPESCAALAPAFTHSRFDLVVYNAGVYGPSTQGLQPPTKADFDHVMHANVLGAMHVLPALAPLLAAHARVAVISSRMGSIGARTSASGWLYRASKAALNSVLKDASLALPEGTVCVALHPGWVRTDMGGAGADLTVTQSVTALRQTLGAVKPEDNGRFFDIDGSELPW
jgi:NAD(P)-dependent dehydrogenase (short-subunit alcohol dehydrogenase family)